jgi:hypothetical protein
MAVARSKEGWSYVLKADRELPPEQRTTFHLRRLSNRTMTALQNLATYSLQNADIKVATGTQRWVTLKAGLAGWTNFLMPDGTPAEFRLFEGSTTLHGVELASSVRDESLELLDYADAMELADAIVDGNELTKADAKN